MFIKTVKIFRRFKYQNVFPGRNLCSNPTAKVEKSCFNLLKTRINMCGPMTVADYMKEIFMNPKMGYYMTKDVFGKDGDFTTSPEVSQLFGEMIAVWCISEWHKLGSPNPHFLIELGPGRGTMMQDILRVFNKIGMNNAGLSVHLVEISKELSKIQAKNLCATAKETTSAHFMEGTTETGVPVYWYNNIESVPTCFSVILAHEFFDALPIHKFQKTKEGWREVLIDIDETGSKLRYVISKAPTPASVYFTADEEKRNHLEVSPQGGIIMQHIAQRLVSHGGFLLLADYGHTGEGGDTFRAFRNHSQQDPLLEPGTSDLTSDVDFSYLKKMVTDKLIAFGPKSQHDFLKSLHIDIRLEMFNVRNIRPRPDLPDLLEANAQRRVDMCKDLIQDPKNNGIVTVNEN